MTYLRIPGIRKYQKRFFIQYYSRLDRAARQSVAKEFREYADQTDALLRREKVSPHQLGIHSRAALFNIEGLANLELNRPHRYVHIYREMEREKEDFPELKTQELILIFTASRHLSHRIELNKNQVRIFTSVASLDLPDTYIPMIARLLFTRASRRKTDPKITDKIMSLEEEYLRPQTSEAPHQNPSTDGRGKHYDLNNIFDTLNGDYFLNELTRPHLQWSHRKNRRKLGAYDSHRHRIVISRILDHPEVPRFVVEGILYHEMLHIIHPVKKGKGRRIFHGTAFRSDEKKFIHHKKLKNWLGHELPRIYRKMK